MVNFYDGDRMIGGVGWNPKRGEPWCRDSSGFVLEDASSSALASARYSLRSFP